MNDPLDLTTQHGWNEYLRWACDRTAKTAVVGDLQLSDCAIVCTVDPFTGTPYEKPMIHIVIVRFVGDTDDEVTASKRHYAMLVRAYAVAGKAFATIFTSEVWTRVATKSEMDADTYVRPMDDPERKEAIMVHSEHRNFGAKVQLAIIEPQLDGTRTIGEFTGESGLAGGTFSNLIPPESILQDKLTMVAARAYLSLEEQKKHLMKIEDIPSVN